MTFIEAFEELSRLNENGPGGQKTYKQFLIALAVDTLHCTAPADYNDGWVLHHIDCDHFNNTDFENLVLMPATHHNSLHAKINIFAKENNLNLKNNEQLSKEVKQQLLKFLEEGHVKKTGEKYRYWKIGEDILNGLGRLDNIQTEENMDNAKE